MVDRADSTEVMRSAISGNKPPHLARARQPLTERLAETFWRHAADGRGVAVRPYILTTFSSCSWSDGIGGDKDQKGGSIPSTV